MHLRNAIAFITLLLVLTACSTTVLLRLLTRPADRVVKTWQRPDGLYCLSVVEGDRDWGGLLYADSSPRYYIYTGHDCGQPSYGHIIDFTPGGYLDEEGLFKKSRVDWQSDGVTFTFPMGHRLLIPKAAYEGGR